jgi:hypothetical protein
VLDERRKQTPPTLAHELNERLQEEAFQLELNLIRLMTPKTSTLPQKSQHEHPF